MSSISTLIYTAELILCFTIYVLSATQHNIHSLVSMATAETSANADAMLF